MKLVGPYLSPPPAFDGTVNFYWNILSKCLPSLGYKVNNLKYKEGDN